MCDFSFATNRSQSTTILSLRTILVSLLIMSILCFSFVSSLGSTGLSLLFSFHRSECRLPDCFLSKLGLVYQLDATGLSHLLDGFDSSNLLLFSDCLLLFISLISICTSSSGIDWLPPLFLKAADEAGAAGLVSYFGDLNLFRSSFKMSWMRF